MLFQLKSVGARECWCLRKWNRLVLAKGGENKWDSIFSPKECDKSCSAGAWDLLPAAPVPPALCLDFVQLQLHIIWRKCENLSVQFLSAGWNYFHWSRQEQCKGFPTYVTFLYHKYNSFIMLRNKHVLVNRSGDCNNQTLECIQDWMSAAPGKAWFSICPLQGRFGEIVHPGRSKALRV